MTPDTGSDAPKTGESVLLNGRFEIFPYSPLPTLDTAAGPAFMAKNLRDISAANFAVLGKNALPTRASIMAQAVSIKNGSLVNMLDSGYVDWPGDGLRYPAIILSQPPGTRLQTAPDIFHGAMREDDLVKNVMTPILSVLREFASINAAHGRIHPGNMFALSDSSGVTLGEYVSMPASYDMPTLYLTAERGMAGPAARGEPLLSDDLYALGMTILVLAIGANPAAGMDNDKIIAAKIDQGSLSSFLGQNHLRGDLLELLRGLLADSPRQRWQLSDVEGWLIGRRPQAKPAESSSKPARPFLLEGKDYWSPRALARGLAANPQPAASAIGSGDVTRWISRTIGNPVIAGELDQTISACANNVKTEIDAAQYLSRILMALDPSAPLRYKNIAVMPSGLGPLLAEYIISNGNVQILAELAAGPLFQFWMLAQREKRPENIIVGESLERARAFILRSQMGYGLERALYDLTPSAPCLSPLIKRFNAYTPAHVLLALDKLATETAPPARPPTDRHIAAFLASHDPRVTDHMLASLNKPESDMEHTLGVLNILSEVQRRHGNMKLPGLAGWLAGMLEPLAMRFRKRQTQERIKASFKKVAASGNLSELLNLVDDPAALEQDKNEFQASQQLYQQFIGEIRKHQEDIQNRELLAIRIGRPIAAAVSGVLSFMAILALTIFSVIHAVKG